MSITIQQLYSFENPFKPDPLIRKALPYLGRRGELLDAGCGEGADSAFLARKGFRVTAVDGNREYLNRFRRYCKDRKLTSVRIHHSDLTTHPYPRDRYDVIISVLVVCCMKRSSFENILPRLTRSLKPGGILVMSARNYLDPELADYLNSPQIEPNTFRNKDDCCKFQYFLEKDRFRELFDGFEILHYYEGFAPCKYGEHEKHGDSEIVCRKRKAGRPKIRNSRFEGNPNNRIR